MFVAPEGDHYRTRLTHTLEVTEISRTVARALALNEDLAEAIGLGHDLGHPPFGHIGEDVLDRCLRERFGGEGFHHWEQSLRVVDSLERDGRGLNLTDAGPRRDPLPFRAGAAPATLEGAIVRLTDRFAYINHDIDDAVRAGVLGPRDLPAEADRGARVDAGRRGSTHSSTTSSSTPQRGRGDRPGRAGGGGDGELRDFMFEQVYLGPSVAPGARQDRERGPHACSSTTASIRRRSPGSTGTWPSASPTTSPA